MTHRRARSFPSRPFPSRATSTGDWRDDVMGAGGLDNRPLSPEHFNDPFLKPPPSLGLRPSESTSRESDLHASLESDALLSIDIKSRGQGSNFYIPVALMIERELMMRQTAKEFGIGPERWANSLLYREWLNGMDDDNSAVGNRSYRKDNGDVKLYLDPERDCAQSNHSHSLEWMPWMTTCIRAFYNTGTVRIPDDCIGSDILLALEYFGIVYTPEQLVFDSFGAYLRVKLWSEYFTHRAKLAQWVVQWMLNTNSKHAHTFVTSPSPNEGDIMVSSKRAVIFDGDLRLDPSKYVDTPSRAVVHDFFNDEEQQDENPFPLDALMREDFACYVQSSLPGTRAKFTVKDVQILKTGQTVKRSTLHIDFVASPPTVPTEINAGNPQRSSQHPKKTTDQLPIRSGTTNDPNGFDQGRSHARKTDNSLQPSIDQPRPPVENALQERHQITTPAKQGYRVAHQATGSVVGRDKTDYSVTPSIDQPRPSLGNTRRHPTSLAGNAYPTPNHANASIGQGSISKEKTDHSIVPSIDHPRPSVGHSAEANKSVNTPEGNASQVPQHKDGSIGQASPSYYKSDTSTTPSIDQPRPPLGNAAKNGGTTKSPRGSVHLTPQHSRASIGQASIGNDKEDSSSMPSIDRPRSPAVLLRRIGSGFRGGDRSKSGIGEKRMKLNKSPSADHMYNDIRKLMPRPNSNKRHAALSVDHAYSGLEEKSTMRTQPVERNAIDTIQPVTTARLEQRTHQVPRMGGSAPFDETGYLNQMDYRNPPAPILSTSDGDVVTVASGITSPWRDDETAFKSLLGYHTESDSEAPHDVQRYEPINHSESKPDVTPSIWEPAYREPSRREPVNVTPPRVETPSTPVTPSPKGPETPPFISRMPTVPGLFDSGAIRDLADEDTDEGATDTDDSGGYTTDVLSSSYGGYSTKRKPEFNSGSQCSGDVITSTLCYMFQSNPGPTTLPSVRESKRISSSKQSHVSSIEDSSIGRGRGAMSAMEAFLPELDLQTHATEEDQAPETLDKSASSWLRNTLSFTQFIYDDPLAEDTDEYLLLARRAASPEKRKSNSKCSGAGTQPPGVMVKEILDSLMVHNDNCSVPGSTISTSGGSSLRSTPDRGSRYKDSDSSVSLKTDNFIPCQESTSGSRNGFQRLEKNHATALGRGQQGAGMPPMHASPERLRSPNKLPPSNRESPTRERLRNSRERLRFPTPKRNSNRTPLKPREDSRNGVASKERHLSPLSRIPGFLRKKDTGNISETTPTIHNGRPVLGISNAGQMNEEYPGSTDVEKKQGRISGMFGGMGRRKAAED